jgi:hypothetical protein
VNEQIEHLRLDNDAVGAATQLAPFGIERKIRKQKLHCGAPDLLRFRSHEIDREIAVEKFQIVSNCRAGRRHFRRNPRKTSAFAGASVTEAAAVYQSP